MFHFLYVHNELRVSSFYRVLIILPYIFIYYV